MSSDRRREVAGAEPGREVGARGLDDVDADPEVGPGLGDEVGDRGEPRVRVGRHREQLHLVRGLAALGRPDAVLLLPACVGQGLGRRLRVVRHRGDAGVVRPGRRRDQRTRRDPVAAERIGDERVAVDGPEQRLAHANVSQLRMRRAQVEQDGREGRGRVAEAVDPGLGRERLRVRPGAGPRSRRPCPSRRPRRRSPRRDRSGPPSARWRVGHRRRRRGHGRDERVERRGRRRRRRVGRAGHEGCGREDGHRVVELRERVAPGAHGRLPERARRQVGERTSSRGGAPAAAAGSRPRGSRRSGVATLNWTVLRVDRRRGHVGPGARPSRPTRRGS